MSLAVGQACYDSRRGQALTFPALVGRETVVWDVVAELVRQGGLVVAGHRGAPVAVGDTKLPPSVFQSRMEITEEGY
eukprot:4683771-Pyramimonas_sp.AAC.1